MTYDQYKLDSPPEDVEATRKAERRQAIIAAVDKALDTKHVGVDCTCRGYSLVVEAAIDESEQSMEAMLDYLAIDFESVARSLRSGAQDLREREEYERGKRDGANRAITRVAAGDADKLDLAADVKKLATQLMYVGAGRKVTQ